MIDPQETDEPHSGAGHNPFWCGGNNHGYAPDDPCWKCISWLHGYANEVRKNLSMLEDAIGLAMATQRLVEQAHND